MYNYNEIEQKVADELIKLGLPISNKGFKYFITGVILVGAECDDIKMTWIYNKIAKIHNSTYSRVERCMRHEIYVYYNNCSKIPSLFEPDIDTGMLTNREFLCRLTYMLRDIFKDSTDKS
jgi:hypothetical protein